LGYGGEEASESGAEIAGGDEGTGKVIGDVFAGLRAALQGMRSVLQGTGVVSAAGFLPLP